MLESVTSAGARFGGKAYALRRVSLVRQHVAFLENTKRQLQLRVEPGAPKAQKHSVQLRPMYSITAAAAVLNLSGRGARSGAEYSITVILTTKGISQNLLRNYDSFTQINIV